LIVTKSKAYDAAVFILHQIKARAANGARRKNGKFAMTKPKNSSLRAASSSEKVCKYGSEFPVL
jgi:hypothetical protein